MLHGMASVDECVAIDRVEGETTLPVVEEEPCYEGEGKAATPPIASGDPTDTVQSSRVAKDHGPREVLTELDVMWHRLAGRGQAVAERMNIDMHKGAAELTSRDSAVVRAFEALDVHGTGSLEVNALRALVTLDEPNANAKEVMYLLSCATVGFIRSAAIIWCSTAGDGAPGRNGS